LLVLGIASTAAMANHYRNQLTQAKAETEQAKQNQKQAEAITSNVITAVTLFNDIAKTTHDKKQQNNEESETRVVYIREALKGDACAVQPVPSAAVDRLREHRNKIRSGSGSADTSRSAG
uniref:DUF2570 domain-containing protein n=1 Tax=Erwinia oleae TaxID=796334 RepID=UPI00068F3AC8